MPLPKQSPVVIDFRTLIFGIALYESHDFARTQAMLWSVQISKSFGLLEQQFLERSKKQTII